VVLVTVVAYVYARRFHFKRQELVPGGKVVDDLEDLRRETPGNQQGSSSSSSPNSLSNDGIETRYPSNSRTPIEGKKKKVLRRVKRRRNDMESISSFEETKKENRVT